MFRNSYFKKFLVPGSTFAATAITTGPIEGIGKGQDDIKSKDKDKNKDDDNKNKDKGTDEDIGPSGNNCDPCTGKLLRRTDLPLYSQDNPDKETPCEEEPGSLEKGISAVRKELWVWHDKYEGYREKVVEIAVNGKEHTAVLIDQLRKDELPVPRSGAIAISGLAGLVLGLRGGWFKRIFYGSTCAGLMAAVCYPKEVAGISQETLATTKKYVLITYNFIYGVKPESLKLPSPSQLLGGPVESPDKGKGDLKSSATTVPEAKPETPVRVVKPIQEHPSLPESQGPQPISPQESPCTCYLTSDRQLSGAHGQEKAQQGLFFTSFSHSYFDRFAEESADVVYWGFRLSR